MPFLTPFESRVISPIENLGMELLDRVPQEAPSGWDSMRDTWLVRHDAAGSDASLALTHADLAAVLARGTQVAGMNMWIVSRAPKTLARGLFRVETVSMGLLTPRGYKVTYDAAAASQTAENVKINDAETYAKVATREGGVTATFEYVVIDSVDPTHVDFLTKHTGRALAPPDGWEPTVPATIWSSLPVFTYNYPNGWVFEGVALENLPGLSTVFLAREKYVHVMAKTPG